MKVGLRQVREAFEYLFGALFQPEFAKSSDFSAYNESELLPLLRFYLLGYFCEELWPEQRVRLPSADTGEGYVDFMIGGIAVEFAVAARGATWSALSPSTNRTERQKLLKYPGPSALVLYDLNRERTITPERLEGYRDTNIFGRGRHRIWPFQVHYFHLEAGEIVCQSLQVRTR